MLKVVFFQRKPLPIHKSVEFIFADVRSRMPAGVKPMTCVFNEYSQGILPRLRIMLQAKREQGDVNHVTGDVHFAAILLDRRRTIMTVLDCIMLSSSKGLKHALLKFFWFTLPLRKCRFVTVISEATKRELLRYVSFPSDRVKVIPVAISDKFRYAPRAFNAECPVILQVGTTANKNIPRLLNALEGINCHLNIVGGLSSDLLSLLSKRNISFTQFQQLSQEEVIAQYEACDILSFVSTYEGFGMPIVEANAVGRPVLTSNLLSMPEVAGNAALLVDPYDVVSIREGLQRLVADKHLRMELIANGLENCKRFDPQRIAHMYLDLYETIGAETGMRKQATSGSYSTH